MFKPLSQRLDNSKLFSYFILAARVLLAWTFIGYGYSKLTGGQFGLSEEELITPIGELSNFRISWFLFDLQPFKTFVGISQLLCGILLLWNRTVLLGAFLFIPIAVNILVMDITFMQKWMAVGFSWRLSYYLLLDALIIWYYRTDVIKIWQILIANRKFNFRFSVWGYLFLPITAIILEFLSPRFFYQLLFHPIETVESIYGFIKEFPIEKFY